MNDIEDIVEGYVREAKIDYSGLWMIASELKDSGIKSDAEVKEKTLLIAQKLMERNILPGHMIKTGGFNFWPGTPAEKLARIAAEWPKEGIPTLVSGCCWFALNSH